MLEPPDFQEEKIKPCLQGDYGLHIIEVVFLPLGADANTAVYRAVTRDGSAYFVKLRRGAFDEIMVRLPRFLSQQGIRQIIAPMVTQSGELWATLEPFRLILYPFIAGRDGYEVELRERQWLEFGAALQRIHTLELPQELRKAIHTERYSPRWRQRVKEFLEQIEESSYADPTASQLAAFLKETRLEVLDLVRRAERLAWRLQARSPEFVLCHSDVHPGNILINDHEDLYIVDWDDPILAPKERDLMFIGGGQGFLGRSPQEENRLFYRGYGQTQIDPNALAYYRYERIVEDIAAFCEQILLRDEGGEDRQQALRYLKSNFLPNNTIEIAYRYDESQSMG